MSLFYFRVFERPVLVAGGGDLELYLDSELPETRRAMESELPALLAALCDLAEPALESRRDDRVEV